MTGHPLRETGLLTPRKVLIQLAGFAVGLALLAWCIKGALAQGGWERLAHADPRLIAGMLGCTAASALLNGTTFWITIRPLRPLRYWDLQRLNLVGNMLNYAPVRLGALARVLYHLRVDGLSLLVIGGWFAVIGYVLVLGIGSRLLATLATGRIGWPWALLVAGQMALGGALAGVVAGLPLLARHGRGIDRILAARAAIWGAVGLRLLDLAAYAGRMGFAAAMLSIELSAAQVVVLAVVALSASLIPFGRLGFREFCVAAAANWLSMHASDVESNMEQLALVESAGEALVFIPAGAVALLWFRRRWLAAPPGTR